MRTLFIMNKLFAMFALLWLVLVEVYCRPSWDPQNPFKLRFSAQAHTCYGDYKDRGVPSVECQANTVCYADPVPICVAKEIRISETCNDDDGCYCQKVPETQMNNVVYARAVCRKGQTCLDYGSGAVLFCGHKLEDVNKKCTGTATCTYVKDNPDLSYNTVTCKTNEVGYITPTLMGCVNSIVLTPNQLCNDSNGCLCDNPGYVTKIESLALIKQGQKCLVNNFKPAGAAVNIDLNKLCENPNGCFCQEGQNFQLSVVCQKDETCLELVTGFRGCRYGSTSVIYDGKKCDQDRACICSSSGKPDVIIRPQSYCYAPSNGPQKSYGMTITAGKLCTSVDGCLCTLQVAETVCKYNEACRQNGNKVECVNVLANKGKACFGSDGYCWNYSTSEIEMCSQGKLCSESGCANEMKIGQVCSTSSPGCVCRYQSSSSSEWLESGKCRKDDTCFMNRRTNKPDCAPLIYSDYQSKLPTGLLQPPENFLCSVMVEQYKEETIICPWTTWCAVQNKKAVCIQNQIPHGLACREDQGCLCRNPDQVANFMLCKTGEYCYVDSVTKTSACLNKVTVGLAKCEDNQGWCYQAIKVPRRIAGVSGNYLEKCNRGFVAAASPDVDNFVGCVNTLVPTSKMVVSPTGNIRRAVIFDQTTPHYIECKLEESIKWLTEYKRPICEGDNAVVTIEPNNYCYNMVNGCRCQKQGLNNNSPLEVLGGEFCRIEGTSLKTGKGDKPVIECPKYLPCKCTTSFMSSHDTDEFCHVDGGLTGNSFSKTMPSGIKPSQVYWATQFRIDDLSAYHATKNKDWAQTKKFQNRRMII